MTLRLKSKLRVGNSSVVKIYIIRPKPGPVAKNATPTPSGWESNPNPGPPWRLATLVQIQSDMDFFQSNITKRISFYSGNIEQLNTE